MKSTDSILIVEDDADVADAMSCILADEGFKTMQVANGEEALAVLASGARPDVILLDLMMPVMDGVEFRRRQARDPRISSIPVVIISADRKVAETAREMGVAGFLRKPVTPSQVLAEIRRSTVVRD
jgi:CheY-like chemotaxis protein